MFVLMECPRCEKRVPMSAAFCRRCGLPLARDLVSHSYAPRQSPLRPACGGGAPPRRLARLVLVGVCAIAFAKLSTRRSTYGPAPYTGYGGGGGTVVVPLKPFDFGTGVQTPGLPAYRRRGFPEGYNPHQPGRHYPPGVPGYTPGRYGPPYGNPYGNPSGNPYGPSSPGSGDAGPRGPGR